MNTMNTMESRLAAAEKQLRLVSAENARLRRLQRIADIMRPAPRFDQAEISAAFTASRSAGLPEAEAMLRALRARQTARDITADSFAPCTR